MALHEELIGLKYSPILVVSILSSWLHQCDNCHPLLLLLPPLDWIQLSPWQPQTQNLLCIRSSSPSNANALAQLQPAAAAASQLVWRRLCLTLSHCCCCTVTSHKLTSSLDNTFRSQSVFKTSDRIVQLSKSLFLPGFRVCFFPFPSLV